MRITRWRRFGTVEGAIIAVVFAGVGPGATASAATLSNLVPPDGAESLSSHTERLRTAKERAKKKAQAKKKARANKDDKLPVIRGRLRANEETQERATKRARAAEQAKLRARAEQAKKQARAEKRTRAEQAKKRARSEHASKAPQAGQLRRTPASIPPPAIWHPCGILDDKIKVVRTYTHSDSLGRPSSQVKLLCGSENWGYRHILKDHRRDWERDAWMTGENWREHADWAIRWVLFDPEKETYNSNNDTYCYSRKLVLVNHFTGKQVDTRRPHVIVASRTENIITAFPSNAHCS